MKAESHAAVSVTCSYFDKSDEEHLVTFHVPENLLWDADYLPYLFNLLRESYLASPEEYPDDSAVEDIWDSWHIKTISEIEPSVFVVPGLFSTPPGLSQAACPDAGSSLGQGGGTR